MHTLLVRSFSGTLSGDRCFPKASISFSQGKNHQSGHSLTVNLLISEKGDCASPGLVE